jgi:hypothetical protein
MYTGIATTGSPNPFIDAANWEKTNLDSKISQLGQEIGSDKNTIISHSAEDGYESWYWDGSKFVSNSGWMVFLFPLIDGATYDLTGASSVSGYNVRRFFSSKPEVNVEISPISDTGNVFVAGGESGIKWLAISLIKSSYDEGDNKYYTFVCYPYGVKSDIKELKTTAARQSTSIASLSHITPLIQAYPYFAGGAVPSIVKSSGDYIITIPTDTLWLPSLNGEQVFTKGLSSPQSFTLSLGQRLVYNRTTTDYEVVASLSGGDYVLLAYNNGGLLEGLFAFYGVNSRFSEQARALSNLDAKISGRFNRNVEMRDISYVEFS